MERLTQRYQQVVADTNATGTGEATAKRGSSNCRIHAVAERLRKTTHHSHSIINKTPKPAWLKGLTVINMGPYRHSYRQHRTSFADAGNGAIRGEATLATPSSIRT